MTAMTHPISPDFFATIEAKEGRHYRLRFSDGQEVLIPVHSLTTEAHLGDKIFIQLFTEQQAQLERNELARTLLEEILNGENT